MTPNKITIEGIDFEFQEGIANSVLSKDTPVLWLNGKRYIGKSIPNGKSEKEFTWTDELVYEFTNLYDDYAKSNKLFWASEVVEEFKNSKVGKAIPNKPEKDYEITETISHGGEVRTLINGLYRIYSDGVGFDLSYILGRADGKIHQVKRLSDNSIWTIGDKTDLGVIENFYIAGVMCVHFTNGNGATLRTLQKVKERKPIFTSYDGIEVYTGDTVYLLSEKTFLINELIVTDELKGHPFTGIDNHFKYFSTKDKAKNYIFHNRPCLSYDEVMNKINGLIDDERYYYIKPFLIELVKEKLNK